MNNARLMEIFMDVQRGLPRQGPGSDDTTRRALYLCAGLPARPNILDVGCGPGKQSLVLADALRGSVTAVDLHQEYLDQLDRDAKACGLREMITPMRADMTDLPFADESFDLVWSEGAAYIMGVENALGEWKRFLRNGGYVAFSELTWFSDHPPQEVKWFFAQEYPAMRDIEANKALVKQAGYRLVGSFSIDESDWWDAYYSPLEAKLPALREKYRSDDEALAVIGMTATEIGMRRKFSSAYGYEFLVAQLTRA